MRFRGCRILAILETIVGAVHNVHGTREKCYTAFQQAVAKTSELVPRIVNNGVLSAVHFNLTHTGWIHNIMLKEVHNIYLTIEFIIHFQLENAFLVSGI